ncbi:unnamed protein product [Leptosia nina]|uniref:PEBP-like protein n=1 Tax=Leptosia nina TaxID=320188 RepID=A0AAV1IZD6_9NEOP
MFFFLFLPFISIFSVVLGEQCLQSPFIVPPTEKLDVVETFNKSGVTDDYLPVPPSGNLELILSSKLIPLGGIISPTLTYNYSLPTYHYSGVKKGELYTVFMLDIDWPSRDNPRERSYINGIVVNNPFDNILGGDFVVPFTPAVPEVNSGYHRYVGLLYKQNDVIDADSMDLLKLAKFKTRFSAVDFAATYNLGNPIAGNIFFSRYVTCS